MMARYSHLASIRPCSPHAWPPPGRARRASAAGVGVALYATAAVKFVVTFERTVFDDNRAGSRPAEHAIVFRAQLNLQPSL